MIRPPKAISYQLLGETKLEQEIVGSCNFIQELIGVHDVPFAFPFGGDGLDRGWLASIMQRNPQINFMFDTHGLAADVPFIINRIEADEPTDMPSSRSGLAWVTRSSYVNELCRKRI